MKSTQRRDKSLAPHGSDQDVLMDIGLKIMAGEELNLNNRIQIQLTSVSHEETPASCSLIRKRNSSSVRHGLTQKPHDRGTGDARPERVRMITKRRENYEIQKQWSIFNRLPSARADEQGTSLSVN